MVDNRENIGENNEENNDDEMRARSEAETTQQGAEQVQLVAHSAESGVDLKTLAELLGISVEELQQLSTSKLQGLAKQVSAKGAGAGRGV